MHGYETAGLFPRGQWGGPELVNSPGDFEDARSRWSRQVNDHSADPRVLGNAACALGQDSMRDYIDLAKRAQKLDPERRTKPLVQLYSMILVLRTEQNQRLHTRVRDPVLAAQIRGELLNSTDASLVGAVASRMVESGTAAALSGRSRLDFRELKSVIAELVTHAQAVDPQNREWSDLTEGVKRLPGVEPARPSASVPTPRGHPTPTVLHSGNVSRFMLLQSSTPAYPAEARAAGVEGVVQLQVRIRKDGAVDEVTTRSGHPLLVKAAIDAVKRYVYKPTLVNGNAVDVITTVDVPFKLEDSSADAIRKFR